METPPIPPPVSPALLLLVDGHALAYRSFHAIRVLNAPGGAPTNAIFGFVKALRRVVARVAPTHLQVVWDGGLAPERLEACPEYKAQRPPMPESLASQLGSIGRYLEAAGVAQFRQPAVEADDWIATAALRAAAAQAQVVILSPDKDFLQLVGPRVSLLNPNDKGGALCGAPQVFERAGVRPEQVADWLSLTGDTVDNIAGVPGVGAKRAAALLARFGSVEALYARLQEVLPAGMRERLSQAQALVRRNQALVRLQTDLPFDFNWESLALRPGEPALLRALFQEWGFHTLAGELDGSPPAQRELW